MAINHKQSSSKVSSLAASTLSDASSSQIAKRLAGSVMSQSGNAKQTGSQMESVASAVLRSPKYNDETKTLAASVLSQANKAR